MIDIFTFGNHAAAINLAHILNAPEHSQYFRKALSMLSKYMSSIREAATIPHRVTRETVMRLWAARFAGQISDTDFPEVIKTHMNNVAIGQKRKWLRVPSRREHGR